MAARRRSTRSSLMASFLRQPGQAQAGDIKFDELGRGKRAGECIYRGDRQSRVDRQQPFEVDARLVEAAEMGIGGRPGAESGGEPRLVMQRAVGPLDSLLEAMRGEMSKGSAHRVEIAL